MRNIRRICATAIVVLVSTVSAQQVAETRLFTIELTDKNPGLFYCKWGGEVRKVLAGPLLMEDNTILFYSENGYVLFDMKGNVVDSHSVFKENKGKKNDDPKRLRCAYPIDKSTLVYYTESPGSEKPLTVFEKKIMKKRMREIRDDFLPLFKNISNTIMFNLDHNATTDEMAAKSYLRPQQVGFKQVERGDHEWWTLDKFYSFSSPVIHVDDTRFEGFWPGIKSSVGSSPEVKRGLVDPLGLFYRHGKTYYAGLYAALGTEEYKYFQKIYICDLAGNVIFTDEFLKQANTDVVLGEDVAGKMYYTAKQTAQIVFQPYMAQDGSLYYGLLDYEKKTLTVYKRVYDEYTPVPSEPRFAHLFDIESGYSYEPVSMPCSPSQQGGSQIPNITFVDQKGVAHNAIPKDLTVNEFLVRLFRPEYRDLMKKLSRRRSSLPPYVETVRDTIAAKGTAGCPYALSVSGPKGIIRSFDYQTGILVQCARVLYAQPESGVIIRVDCEKFAEIVMFKPDGTCINRFTFNTQKYTDRKDLVVCENMNTIMERDFEKDRSKAQYFLWKSVLRQVSKKK